MKHLINLLVVVIVVLCMQSCVGVDPSDPDCDPIPAGTEGGACYGNDTCNDGLDCLYGVCELANDINNEVCNDNVDNDLDGSIDCDDEDCSQDPYCNPGCGNGYIEPDIGEECESEEFRNCLDYGFYVNMYVYCDDCVFDTDICFRVSGRCGDGWIDSVHETCDGDIPTGETCESQGFTGGELGCSEDCQRLDTSECY